MTEVYRKMKRNYHLFFRRINNFLIRRLGLIRFIPHLGIKVRPILVDRIYLEKYLSSLTGKILFLGVDFYTCHYSSLVEAKATLITMDLRPEVAVFGSKKHLVGSFSDYIWDDIRFNHVILNGVLGYGTDSESDAMNMLKTCSQLICDDGVVLVGWNTNKVSVTKFLSLATNLFDIKNIVDSQALNKQQGFPTKDMCFLELIKTHTKLISIKND
jgi:hypothetical protein